MRSYPIKLSLSTSSALREEEHLKLQAGVGDVTPTNGSRGTSRDLETFPTGRADIHKPDMVAPLSIVFLLRMQLLSKLTLYSEVAVGD